MCDSSLQGRRQMERELREARETLRETQERLQSLEEERDQAHQDLCSAKEVRISITTAIFLFMSLHC